MNRCLHFNKLKTVTLSGARFEMSSETFQHLRPYLCEGVGGNSVKKPIDTKELLSSDDI